MSLLYVVQVITCLIAAYIFVYILSATISHVWASVWFQHKRKFLDSLKPPPHQKEE